jgi:hypothetical protein
MQTFKPFDRFVCHNDTRTVEVDGLTIVATIYDDMDTNPGDFDCYTESDVRAWKDGDWCYVGVVLSVYAGETLLVDHAASLWGIECNYLSGNNEYLSEVANDLLSDAVWEGKSAAIRLRDSLQFVAA